MGLFSRKAAAPPVRRAQVLKLTALVMAESDADRDDDTPEWRQAKGRLEAAIRNSSQAEVRAAFEAAKRHGYT
jgi:hypothetical protein